MFKPLIRMFAEPFQGIATQTETSTDDPQDMSVVYDSIESADEDSLFRGNARSIKPVAVGIPSSRSGGLAGSPVDTWLVKFQIWLERKLGFKLIDIHLFVEELCTMRKTAGKACAVPHPILWPNTLFWIRNCWIPARTAVGFPLQILNMYRPNDYNLKVAHDAPDSIHTKAGAGDLLPSDSYNTSQNRWRLVEVGADLVARKGKELKMGFGVYGAPKAPSDIHLDAGLRAGLVMWEHAKLHVDRALAELSK